MERRISEADLEALSPIPPHCDGAFLHKALSEAGMVLGSPRKTAHERFLAALELFDKRRDELVGTFDDVRRSAARRQLAAMASLGLLTEDELARFSLEVREVLRFTWETKAATLYQCAR